MQHAISPVGRDLAEHMRKQERFEAFKREVDRRSDAIRSEIEAGDWRQVEDFLAEAPEAQKAEFYMACIELLLPVGADLRRDKYAKLAAPLQEAVALGIEERVRREINRDVQESNEKPWRHTA